jgi:hypothetical protein
MRLKPSSPSSSTVARSTLRGSTSIEYSPPSISLKCLACRGHQLAHLVVRKEGRRAATPVQLRHFLIAALEIAALQRQFACQIFQVLGRTTMVLGDDLVARAVITDGVAERNVEVQ